MSSVRGRGAPSRGRSSPGEPCPSAWPTSQGTGPSRAAQVTEVCSPPAVCPRPRSARKLPVGPPPAHPCAAAGRSANSAGSGGFSAGLGPCSGSSLGRTSLSVPARSLVRLTTERIDEGSFLHPPFHLGPFYPKAVLISKLTHSPCSKNCWEIHILGEKIDTK